MMDVSHLTAVSLTELEAGAALQTRRDRKYLVPAMTLDRLLARLSAEARVLDIGGRRSFQYRSVYFDSAEMTLYFMTARGRPRRTKVRVRTYLDSGKTLLEVKVRDGRGWTVKHRYQPGAAGEVGLSAEAHRAVERVDGRLSGMALQPALITRYSRTTLLLADGSRATIDTNLRFELPGGEMIEFPSSAILETKSRGIPTSLDRVLWSARHRPVRFSKYGTGRAALDRRLPANRWHRVLRTLVAS